MGSNSPRIYYYIRRPERSEHNIKVHLIDASHCPGSVLILRDMPLLNWHSLQQIWLIKSGSRALCACVLSFPHRVCTNIALD
jgi:hypothetical protein